MKKTQYRQDKETLDNLLKEKDLIVYGKGQKIEEVYLQYKNKIKYIVDQNDELCDLFIHNIPIYLPEKLYCENPTKVIILICTDMKYHYDITRQLLDIHDFSIFYWEVLTNHLIQEKSCVLYDNYEHIEQLAKELYDDYSKKVLFEIVHRRMAGVKDCYMDLKIKDEIQYMYMPALFSKTKGAILDCGGYIGDSICRFINRLGNDINKIYSFEVFPENIKAIEAQKANLSKVWDGEIIIIPYAVADEPKQLTFYETIKKGAVFAPDFRSEIDRKAKEQNKLTEFQIQAVRIDDVIGENEHIRYIKMDIEGAEYEALIGAKNTIQREKPSLGISIYHNAQDYYRLAELIRSYVPEYKLAIRHHKNSWFDSVLYAWI